MFKNLKSQAALEFLTTYGWAFLVIMIMIGSLAYFGILSPSKLLPNRCNFGSEFTCVDYKIVDGGTGTDTFGVKLKNNLGEQITVAAGGNNILKTEDGTAIAGCVVAAVATWDFAKNADLEWTSCAAGTWNKGDKAKVLVTVEYKSTKTGAYLRQVQGEVYTTVT